MWPPIFWPPKYGLVRRVELAWREHRSRLGSPGRDIFGGISAEVCVRCVCERRVFERRREEEAGRTHGTVDDSVISVVRSKCARVFLESGLRKMFRLFCLYQSQSHASDACYDPPVKPCPLARLSTRPTAGSP